MKPFDLERAKAGDPIGCQSFNGLGDATIEYLRDDMGPDSPILIRYRHPERKQWFPVLTRPNDLYMLPKKRTVYAVVWLDDDGDVRITPFPYRDEAAAVAFAKEHRESRYTSGHTIYHEALPIEIEE